MICFTQAYLQKCPKDEYIIGYYYQKNKSCIKDFRILKDDFNYDNINLKAEKEETVYKVELPDIRINICYKMGSDNKRKSNIFCKI